MLQNLQTCWSDWLLGNAAGSYRVGPGTSVHKLQGCGVAHLILSLEIRERRGVMEMDSLERTRHDRRHTDLFYPISTYVFNIAPVAVVPTAWCMVQYCGLAA
jgi:hypothetical protein